MHVPYIAPRLLGIYMAVWYWYAMKKEWTQAAGVGDAFEAELHAWLNYREVLSWIKRKIIEFYTTILYLKKKNSKISLETKLKTNIVRNADIHDSGNWLLKCLSKTASNLKILSSIAAITTILEIRYSVTTLFVPKTIILVANNNLQLKNVGRKVIAICLSWNVFYDHLLTLSQIICLRDE